MPILLSPGRHASMQVWDLLAPGGKQELDYVAHVLCILGFEAGM